MFHDGIGITLVKNLPNKDNFFKKYLTLLDNGTKCLDTGCNVQKTIYLIAPLEPTWRGESDYVFNFIDSKAELFSSPYDI